jgi:cell fate regulator YaaT (PSP1 superfamily)
VPMMCAVSFERYGRLYYFDAGELRPRVGDKVLVPTDEGPEVAEVVWAPEYVAEPVTLSLLVGPATAADLAQDERHRALRGEARKVVKRLVREHDLPMKLLGIDYVPYGARHGPSAPVKEPADRGGPRYTVYFGAPERVDFRALVRDLARTLSARVELRQVGARDEARVQGGIGPCGRDLCCATFLKDFEPVSIRMAKDQDLPLNPLKISGACGRLMCCLKYEHPLYQEFKADLPALGSQVETDEGDGRLVGYNVPAGNVVVRLSASGERRSCSKASVCGSREAFDGRTS